MILEFCINSDSSLPDNPIHRALLEKNKYDEIEHENEKESSYSLYSRSRNKLDNNEFEEALPLIEELYQCDPSEENLLLLALCQYKISEGERSCKSLIDCLNFILANINIETCCSEKVFGRLAAIYRTYGLTPTGKAGAKQLGAFATTEFAESRIDVKMRLAFDPQWKNALYIEEKIVVPKDIIINVGVVAPVKLLSGTILDGGADQILLPYNWSEEWVVGYRFVTSEPLMDYPEYTKEKPNEIRKK